MKILSNKNLKLVVLICFITISLFILLLFLNKNGFFETRDLASYDDNKVDLSIESDTLKEGDSSFTISIKIYPDGNPISGADLSLKYDNSKLNVDAVIIRKGEGQVVENSAVVLSNFEGISLRLKSGVCKELNILCLAFSNIDFIYNRDKSKDNLIGDVFADVKFSLKNGSFKKGDSYKFEFVGADTNIVGNEDFEPYPEISLNGITINVQSSVCKSDCSKKSCGEDDGCGGICKNCTSGENCIQTSTGYSCVETCNDSCQSLNYSCGNHVICGESQNCGVCPDDNYCTTGGFCLDKILSEDLKSVYDLDKDGNMDDDDIDLIVSEIMNVSIKSLNENYDLNKDGLVDILDVATFVKFKNGN